MSWYVYEGQPFKFFCNECNTHWFAKNQFEDLCPHCESEHIFEREISDFDKKMHQSYVEELSKIDARKIELADNIANLPWIKH